MVADEDETEAHEGAPEESSPLQGRSMGRKIALSLVLGVLVFAGLSAYADLEALTAQLRAFQWSAFAIGLFWATTNYVIRWVRWEYYLRRLKVSVPPFESVLIFLAGFIMSITPGKLGEVYKSWLLLERGGHSMSRTAPIVVAERLTDLLALVILAGIGGLAFPAGRWIALFGGVFVLVVLAACMWRPFGMFLIALASRLPLARRIAPALERAYDSLQTLLTPSALLVATGLSTVSWFTECICLYYIAAGFGGAGLDLLSSTFAYAGPTIVGALAMLPGGLGLTEATMTGTLQAMQGEFGPATASAITILVRIATLWWAVLLGALALIPLQRRPAARLR